MSRSPCIRALYGSPGHDISGPNMFGGQLRHDIFGPNMFRYVMSDRCRARQNRPYPSYPSIGYEDPYRSGRPAGRVQHCRAMPPGRDRRRSLFVSMELIPDTGQHSPLPADGHIVERVRGHGRRSSVDVIPMRKSKGSEQQRPSPKARASLPRNLKRSRNQRAKSRMVDPEFVQSRHRYE